MKFGLKLLAGVTFVLISCLLLRQSASTAQPLPSNIRFDSFTGIYHLSRDSRGLSQLSTEETIVADFPGNGRFYGIKREIPKKYQNRSTSVKVLGVVDTAGNPVPYEISHNNDSLTVTTGDPDISLIGSQTIKIKYQTSGVINLSRAVDEFLLNVNGRGWDQPFNSVDATIYIPNSFRASIKGQPDCYTSLGESKSQDCEIKTSISADRTVITAKTKSLAAHEALVLSIKFKPATFTNQRPFWQSYQKYLAVALIPLAAGAYFYLRKR